MQQNKLHGLQKTASNTKTFNLKVSAGVRAGRNYGDGITVQFENKLSEENENGSRKLGWVSLLREKNVIFVHLWCIKGGSPLSKFPECKALVVSNYLLILISRFLYLPPEVNSSRPQMVKWWISRKTRHFMRLAALLSEHFWLIREWRCKDIDVCLCCLNDTIKHYLFVETHEALFRNTNTFSGILDIIGRMTV